MPKPTRERLSPCVRKEMTASRRSVSKNMNRHVRMTTDEKRMFMEFNDQSNPSANGGELFGINAKAGLRMLAGNAGMYARLLKTYAAGTLYAEFVAAVDAGNVQEAASKAHALKGVSANLSLNPVFEQIRDMEARLKVGEMIAPDHPDMATLKELYDKTLASIAVIVADPTILNAYK